MKEAAPYFNDAHFLLLESGKDLSIPDQVQIPN